MSELLLLAAALIIVVLASVALWLHWRLHKLRQSQRQAQAVAETKRLAQRANINRSIQVLARALQAEQVNATEASIRISVLMDALQVDSAVKAEFTAFYKLAEEASHIPVLDAWQALPKSERNAFSRELAGLETKYGDFVADAATRIQGHIF